MSTLKGIDVSEAQKTLDWASLKKAGVQFAVVRIGIGVHARSGMREDYYFRQNIAGCESAGIPYGLYFFCYATNATEVKTECEYAHKLIKEVCNKKPFMVSYDFEDDTLTRASANGVTLGKSQYNEFIGIWNKYFTSAGYETPTYINYSLYYTWFNKSVLGGYPIWAAYYNHTSCFVSNYAMWQYGYAYYNGQKFDADYASSDFVNGTTAVEKKSTGDEEVQTYTNKASVTYCYADTTKKTKTGSLNASEVCECLGMAGSMYIVRYKVDGSSSTYKIGLVDYAGGTKW